MVEPVVFGCCDLIGQFILVRTSDKSFSFIYSIFKDTPLLDCVGLQYPCCYHSFNVGIRILRFVDLFSCTRWNWLFPLVMWTTSIGGQDIVQNALSQTSWSGALTLASLIASMTVNTLATGLIVFRIFKVFREVKDVTTSDEKSLGFTGGRKLRSVIFIIIESGMALLVIQMARVVLLIIDISSTNLQLAWKAAYNFVLSIHEMLNVITSSVIVILLITWTWLGYSTNPHPGAGFNGIVFPWRVIVGRICR